ncbi:MAG: thioredoxin [Candidatus Gastranaerophilales bacterium]|nr:thioredoxin [Candidatus Gastranaerophilales bacterium]
MADIKDINDNNFQAKVLEAANLTIVDFFAPWCGPCKKMAEVIGVIADEYAGKVDVYKLNTDENLKIAQEYSISSLPTVLIFKDGEPKERLVGLMPKSAIIKNIEKYL